AATARRCASPSARESRSMADKDKKGDKAKAEKPQADKADKAPKQDKAPKAAKGDKPAQAAGAERAAKAPKGDKKEGAATAPRPGAPRVPPRLRKHYDEVVRKTLKDQFGYKNAMQVPALDKIVINMGIGEGVNDRKKVESAAADLGMIAGQRAVI